MLTDGQTDDGVTGILLAHPWAFGSGELKILNWTQSMNFNKHLSAWKGNMYLGSAHYLNRCFQII